MADFNIDQSSLPTVNTVCREFAVREDHSLAHNLQEQEIEHHLASNVQRNRLVQNDLQMAKKLQEEENKKAQIRLQKQQREMERWDNQMAQVIQDELTLESEKRRRQEEKDEAIARKLQEKEEKLRRKYQHENIGREQFNVGFEENGDHMKSRVRKHDRNSRHGSDSHRNRDFRYKRDSHLKSPVESSSKSKVDDWVMKPTMQSPKEKSHCSKTVWNGDYLDVGHRKLDNRPNKKKAPRRPPPPVLNSSNEAASNYYSQGARPKVFAVQDEYCDLRERNACCQKATDKTPHDCSLETVGARAPSPEELLEREHEMGEDNEMSMKEMRRAARSQSPDLQAESNHYNQEKGPNPRIDYAMKEAIHGISKMSAKDLEWKDAELARKLQEEEIMAIQNSKRGAQMAQDEEIARLLMEEEKKHSHRKSKEKDSTRRGEEDRRKGSSEHRRHDQDKKQEVNEHFRPKPRDGSEQLTGKSERPVRSPTYQEESTPQRPPRSASRPSESSQQVSYYRQ
ncbi:coiled-coil domain-containing protein 50 isoform X3 [Stegostoma tigrinum]|uniref:coiled-coil domain-containing protein 50 isoform X3 n=1 Tax=Stegostoma tigrinum TaxID=3053191 RepID=UPI00202ADECB|nr:coiled-coil domain-containing protein 50 isoform X3 [Stegostoma tigrinum]